MAKRETWHVLPNDNDGWSVKKEKAQRASSRHEKKTEAVEAAKKIAKNQELGQVIVHKQDGTIQQEFTYGQDPRRSKG